MKLFSGCAGGVIQGTEVSSGKCLRSFEAHSLAETRGDNLRAFPRGVLALVCSREGTTLFSGGSDRCLHAWNIDTGKGQRLLRDQYVTAVALSPDGRLLASAGYHSDLRLLDSTRGIVIRQIPGQSERITAVLFSPDGKTLLTGGVTMEKSTGYGVICSDTICTWDAATGEQGPSLRGKASQLTPAGDGRTVLASGLLVAREKDPTLRVSIASGDDRFTIEHAAELWDLRSGKKLWSLSCQGMLAAASPDGKFLAILPGEGNFMEVGSGGGNAFGAYYDPERGAIWDLGTGQVVFEVPAKDATAVAFSPDGKRLAIGTRSGKVLVCDLEENRPRFSRPRPQEELWKDLAALPTAAGYRAQWTLGRGGPRSVEFLTKKLLPPPDLDPRAIRRTIQQLDDDRFTSREAASKALEQIGAPAYRFVKQAMMSRPTPEVSRRIAVFLANFEDAGRPGPEVRRCLAALEILGEISTRQARQVLQLVAEDRAMFPIREAAREVLARIAEQRDGPTRR
jgi:WD40 repeat protein